MTKEELEQNVKEAEDAWVVAQMLRMLLILLGLLLSMLCIPIVMTRRTRNENQRRTGEGD